eukprot:c16216_g1_i1 orf=230-478(+)
MTYKVSQSICSCQYSTSSKARRNRSILAVLHPRKANRKIRTNNGRGMSAIILDFLQDFGSQPFDGLVKPQAYQDSQTEAQER